MYSVGNFCAWRRKTKNVKAAVLLISLNFQNNACKKKKKISKSAQGWKSPAAAAAFVWSSGWHGAESAARSSGILRICAANLHWEHREQQRLGAIKAHFMLVCWRHKVWPGMLTSANINENKLCSINLFVQWIINARASTGRLSLACLLRREHTAIRWCSNAWGLDAIVEVLLGTRICRTIPFPWDSSVSLQKCCR